MPVITAVLGDISMQDADAVVNAANNAMRGGGGVDGAIHRRGGPEILRDCVARFPSGLATGDAGWTTAGDLAARWVIHTVGPNYAERQRDRTLLESCYRRALAVADELGARTVAFPLISTGIYGWPRGDAIEVAIETIATAGTRVDEVRLVAHDEGVYRQIRAQLLIRYPPPVGPGTVGALFDRRPYQLGLRGDSYLWRELRARFADTPLPDSWFTLKTLVTKAIEQLVGASLDGRDSAPWGDRSGTVYRPEFDPGYGMSAGSVHLQWWNHTGVPILLDRYAAAHEGSGE